MEEIEDVMTKVEKILQLQRHYPELFSVYVIFVFIFILLLGIYGTLRVTRNSIVNFLCKEAIQNARLGDLLPRPLDPNLPLSAADTKALYKLRKNMQISHKILPLHHVAHSFVKSLYNHCGPR